MSLKIIKAGILDSLQDAGRFGFRHLGINPTGAMDLYAASVANLLVGNSVHEGVLELHFPASVIQFEKPAILSLTGGDFLPMINDEIIPLYKPVYISENSVLRFNRPVQGHRCYLSVYGGFKIPKWLNSASTHFKAEAGGWLGRKLLSGDCISINHQLNYAFPDNKPFEIFHCDTEITGIEKEDHRIFVLFGREWSWMTRESQQLFLSEEFTITLQSDRMGYNLKGPGLTKENSGELVSAPVTFGTIQLLPNGSLIILMADHQTTGGYPVIGNVISAHHSKLAQIRPGDKIRFQKVDIREAEKLWMHQNKLFGELEKDSHAKMKIFLEKNN